MRITIGIILIALASAPRAARADRRTMIRAYEFQTQPQGNLELELWNDVEAPQTAFADSVVVTRVELEYGLTDRWDMALYHVFEQGGPPATAPNSFHFDSWRLETRYRLAEKGEWPIDVMLYGELERPADFNLPFETEEKLILEKDFGQFAVVTNLVAEQHLFRADLGHAWEFDLGARYELMPQLRAAVEFWTTQEYVGADVSRNYYLGPSLSVATQRVWIQLGVGFGLDASQDQQMFIRSVLGFNL
ncbi:MAG TPA: hypothetical protein VG496_11525 [Myxococcales bacterium]|nr:hypothetical protein [Myxococcales bacterium]